MLARYILSLFLLLTLLASPATAQGALEAIMGYCKPDIQRLCGGVEPGGGRVMQCLKARKEEMSVGCAMALMKMKKKMGT